MKKVILGLAIVSALAVSGCKMDFRDMPNKPAGQTSVVK